jgi:hypothetical protein
MPREAMYNDVTAVQDFPRLAREIARTGKAQVFRDNGEALVVVSPARPVKRHAAKTPTAKAIEAALAAAGSWKGLVDPEEFKRQRQQLQIDDKPVRNL